MENDPANMETEKSTAILFIYFLEEREKERSLCIGIKKTGESGSGNALHPLDRLLRTVSEDLSKISIYKLLMHCYGA